MHFLTRNVMGGGGEDPCPLHVYIYCIYYMALNAGIHKGNFFNLSVHVNVPVPINHNINNITDIYLTFIFYPVPTYTYL